MILIVSVLTALINIVLGLFTYFTNPKSTTNRLFALLTIEISIWSIVNYLSLSQGTESATLFWIRMDMLPGALMGPTIYLLVRSFPKPKLQISKSAVALIVVLILTTMLLAVSPDMFTQVIFENGNIKAIPGPGIAIFAINFLGSLLLAFITLIKKYRVSADLERIQLRYLLFGLIATFSLVAVTQFLFVIVFNTSFFIPFGPVYSLILVGSIAYAMVKYQLFDIKVIATEVFAIILWIVLFSRLFTSQTSPEFAINISILLIVVFFGILLIRSVRNEVSQRQRLEELTEKLKELDKRKDEFLNMASHELRAPMTAIKGYVSMIIEGDAGVIPEKARGFLTDASGVTDRLIRLVNNMLNVSRIEENRMVFQVDTINLSEVARESYSEFKGEAVRKNLQFDLVMPPEVKDRVKVDTDRIHEVVANLISNAIKYTEKGSINVKLSQPDPKHVRLEVIDTGPGVSAQEQVKLFQKFVRAESAIGKTVGTGLGLYISKLLVEKFGGKIGLISEVDKGSNFWFELPLAE